MRGNWTRSKYAILFISMFCLLLVPEVRSETPMTVGGFQWGGDIELGYRITDVDGRNRYKEVVNLSEGLRLFDLSLFGKDLDQKGLVDTLSFNLHGIGDPFPSGRFEIKKNKSYDVVATYKEYKYFFDRTDTPFTDNHNFNTRNKRGTLALSLFPKDDVQLNFGYSRWQRDGDGAAPRFSAVSFPFTTVEQDFEEKMDEFFVSADFPIGNWDFHVKQSYWQFKNKDSTASTVQFEDIDSDVKTWVSTLQGHTRVGDRWDFDIGYVFAHSDGEAKIATSPVVAVTSGRNDLNFNTHVVELGLSYLLMKEWILHFDYRFHTLDQDGRFNTDANPTPLPDNNTEYDLRAHTGTLQLEYLPRENLTLRAGYRLQYRDIDGENFAINAFDGGKDPQDTDILAHGWIASADWKPYKFLNFYGEYQGAHFDNPYTRISMEDENLAKVRVKYDTPLPNLSLKGLVTWKRKKNPDQDYQVDSQDYTLALTYQPVFIPRLSLDGSFTYEKIHDRKDIVNAVPTSVTDFVFNSSAYIYSGGVTYEGIYRGLGARLYGSYAKTLQENSQTYGDLVFSLWYKNKWLVPILTLERTYLVDRMVRNDGFDANLLTFSLRKDF
jgi:opacity protein-like surface antigen